MVLSQAIAFCGQTRPPISALESQKPIISGMQFMRGGVVSQFTVHGMSLPHPPPTVQFLIYNMQSKTGQCMGTRLCTCALHIKTALSVTARWVYRSLVLSVTARWVYRSLVPRPSYHPVYCQQSQTGCWKEQGYDIPTWPFC